MDGPQDGKALKSCTFEATGKLAASVIKDSVLKVYAGAPHVTCVTNQDDINSELLAFIKG